MCENCQNLFDIKNNLPYILNCGHTICEKCLNILEFKNNKIECNIDKNIYETSKDKIPKNEMLIEYMLSNKLGPRYSYQIREYVIEQATFSHIIKRNCCQKILHFLYKLFYVKIFLTIVNILLFPFKKIYNIIKKIINILYVIYLQIKSYFLKILNKIKAIRFPKLNINCKFFDKIKIKLVNNHLIREIIIFFKFTIRAPLWVNYIKIMKNLIYQSQSKVNNICLKVINIIIALIGIISVHIFAYFTSSLANLFIIVLLLNETTIVLFDFMKMDDEKGNKKYLKKEKRELPLKKNRRKSESLNYNNNTFNEEEEEYFIDENKYKRGKKCIVRWIGFMIFWYFSPLIKELFYNYIHRWKNDEISDNSSQENIINIWRGIVNSLKLIPKLIIIIYLTS